MYAVWWWRFHARALACTSLVASRSLRTASSCPSFSIMANRPDKLVLALGEQCGAERAADAAPGKAFEVQSLEHIQAVVMQILQERNIQIGQSSTEAMQAMQ